MTGEEDEELKKENREIGVVAEWGCFLFAYPLADGQMGALYRRTDGQDFTIGGLEKNRDRFCL